MLAIIYITKDSSIFVNNLVMYPDFVTYFSEGDQYSHTRDLDSILVIKAKKSSSKLLANTLYGAGIGLVGS